jgi:uncharacterized membrane protein YphA (DoxX/SURF4 family)
LSAVASLISLVLFLAFATSGLQRILFNPAMSHLAERLGYSKASFRRLGVAEMVGAVGLLVGLASTGSSVLAIINEVAAAALTVIAFWEVAGQLRRRDTLRSYSPMLAMGVLALVELAFRLAA